jgi:hypothetical protein
MSFSSVDNKRLIWSLLLETSYFKGFPASQKDMVKRVLDSVVHEMSQTPEFSKASITDKNKEVVKQMMTYRDLWVQDGTITNENQMQTQYHNTGSNYNQLPLYTSQVTAEEIREKREQEFNNTLRKKQAEMEGFLNANKPTQIDFSDKAIMNQERIGGDMDRLVAEAEAQRKREMDALLSQSSQMSQKEVESWINGGKPLKIDNDSVLPIDAQQISPPRRLANLNSNTNTNRKAVRFDLDNKGHPKNDTDDFFNKLKRKPTSNNNLQQNQMHETFDKNETAISISNEKILKRIDNLENNISQIQNDVKQILTAMTALINKET